MRKLFIICVLLCATVSSPARADGLMIEPHAMFYYQVPLDRADRNAHHQFGFRVDQTLLQRGETPQFRQLMQRPALLDLNLGYDGVHRFTLAGNTYTTAVGVLHQNGEETGAGTEAEQEGPDVRKFIKETPKGWFIGIGIGIALVLGIGD